MLCERQDCKRSSSDDGIPLVATELLPAASALPGNPFEEVRHRNRSKCR
jgi:hypothetical protein